MTTLAEINNTLLDQNLSIKEMVIEQESTNDALRSLVEKISAQMDQTERAMEFEKLQSKNRVKVKDKSETGGILSSFNSPVKDAPNGLIDGLLKGLGFGGGFGIAGFISGLLSKVLGLIGKAGGRLLRTGLLIAAVSAFGEDVINAIFGDSLTDAQKTDMRDALYATATWVGLGGKLIKGLLAGVISYLFPETSEKVGGVLVDGFKTALEKIGLPTDWIDKAMGENSEVITQTLGSMAILFAGRFFLLMGGKVGATILKRLFMKAITGAGLIAAFNKIKDSLKLPFGFDDAPRNPPRLPDVDYSDPTNAPRPAPRPGLPPPAPRPGSTPPAPRPGPNLPPTTPAGKPLSQAAEMAIDIAKGTVTGRFDAKGLTPAQLKNFYGRSYGRIVKQGTNLAKQATDLVATGSNNALQSATKAAGNVWTKAMNGQLMKNGAPATITELIDDIQISKAAKYAKYAKFFKFVSDVLPYIGPVVDAIDPIWAIYTDQPEDVIKTEVAGAIGSMVGARGGFILGAALTAPTGPGAILGGLVGAAAGSFAGEYSAEAIAGYLLGMNPNPVNKQTAGPLQKGDVRDTRFQTGSLPAYGMGSYADLGVGEMNPFGTGNVFSNNPDYQIPNTTKTNSSSAIQAQGNSSSARQSQGNSSSVNPSRNSVTVKTLKPLIAEKVLLEQRNEQNTSRYAEVTTKIAELKKVAQQENNSVIRERERQNNLVIRERERQNRVAIPFGLGTYNELGEGNLNPFGTGNVFTNNPDYKIPNVVNEKMSVNSSSVTIMPKTGVTSITRELLQQDGKATTAEIQQRAPAVAPSVVDAKTINNVSNSSNTGITLPPQQVVDILDAGFALGKAGPF